jgi:hypothetical protein
LFETPTHRWQTAYGVGTTLVLLAWVLDLLTSAPTLSMPMRLAYTLVIVLSTASLARLFEGRRGALRLEALRTSLLLGPLAMGWWFHAVPLGARVAGAGALLVLLATLAMRHSSRDPGPASTTPTHTQELA